MVMKYGVALIGLFALIFLWSCQKEGICRECGYYTGVSQKVDYLPGTTIGSYTTNTKTHQVRRDGKGYRTAGYYHVLDSQGQFQDSTDQEGAMQKGYLSFQVTLRKDTLRFNIQKPGGLSEVFEGIKIN